MENDVPHLDKLTDFSWLIGKSSDPKLFTLCIVGHDLIGHFPRLPGELIDNAL